MDNLLFEFFIENFDAHSGGIKNVNIFSYFITCSKILDILTFDRLGFLWIHVGCPWSPIGLPLTLFCSPRAAFRFTQNLKPICAQFLIKSINIQLVCLQPVILGILRFMKKEISKSAVRSPVIRQKVLSNLNQNDVRPLESILATS